MLGASARCEGWPLCPRLSERADRCCLRARFRLRPTRPATSTHPWDWKGVEAARRGCSQRGGRRSRVPLRTLVCPSDLCPVPCPQLLPHLSTTSSIPLVQAPNRLSLPFITWRWYWGGGGAFSLSRLVTHPPLWPGGVPICARASDRVHHQGSLASVFGR